MNFSHLIDRLLPSRKTTAGRESRSLWNFSFIFSDMLIFNFPLFISRKKFFKVRKNESTKFKITFKNVLK